MLQRPLQSLARRLPSSKPCHVCICSCNNVFTVQTRHAASYRKAPTTKVKRRAQARRLSPEAVQIRDHQDGIELQAFAEHLYYLKASKAAIATNLEVVFAFLAEFAKLGNQSSVTGFEALRQRESCAVFLEEEFD